MNTYYTLKNGSKICLFMWEDFLENKIWREYAEVYSIHDGVRSKRYSKKKLFKDEKGIYIVWDSQKVYLNDFDYTPYNELIKKVNQSVEKHDRWYVMEDEIWATFYKESEKVSIVTELPVYDTIIPMMGIGLYSDKTVPVLTKLSFNQYSKKNMHYKITLTPENEKLLGYVASQSYYFSDFCSMLFSGIFTLVEREKYKDELKKKLLEEEEREKSKGKVQKFFDKFKKPVENENYTMTVAVVD